MRKAVHKTQIYLDDEQYSYLKRQAKQAGSIAAAVRELINERIRGKTAVEDPLLRLGTRGYKSGRSDLAEEHDRYLYGAHE